MDNFIDMHVHILPGVDDGAEDIKEMEEMLKIAYPWFLSDPPPPAKTRKRIAGSAEEEGRSFAEVCP